MFVVGLTSKQRWQIRRIFLQRRDVYSPTEAAKVLGIPRAAIIDGIKAGDIDASKSEHVEYRLTWRTVATIALEKWHEEAIYDALGSRAEDVLPPLMRLDTLTVSVPLYAILMLRRGAETRGISVDEYLRDILHDAAGDALSTDIEKAIPGFRRAVTFPDE